MAKGLVLIIMIMIMPLGVMVNVPLPPEAPRALAIDMSAYRQVRTWHVNMTISLTVSVNWVMLWLNMTAVMSLLGLDNETSRNMTILVNGQPWLVNQTGRYNMSFVQVLDLSWEYHGNITAWWHVVVRHVMPQQSHEAPSPGGEPAWVKYRRALVSAMATVMVGLKAGKDMKEARLKQRRRQLLASKAMDVDQVLRALDQEGET